MGEQIVTLKEIDALFEDCIKRIREYNPHADISLIKNAYLFAKKAHDGQDRISGSPYLIHPVSVLDILINTKADTATLCAGLLHDTLEDTKATNSLIKEQFGSDIYQLVHSLTKIESINFDTKEAYTAENLRKILLATTKDIRVIFIKLADRLHNMRTLKYVRDEKQKRIARETMDIFAPIAAKLGLYNIKGELEDLSFRYLDPKAYDDLKNRVNLKREERVQRTQTIMDDIKRRLSEKDINATVYGRAKYFYSIYKKMIKDNKDFNEIYDLIAIRIITNTVEECYSALGVVHHMYKPMPHRFKDYISIPKANGYQSLHTTVAGSHGRILEIQIRTEHMHKEAEEGIASHWLYKGTERDKQFDQRITWLKQFLEWKQSSDDAKDFIDSLKFDLFQNEIIVFTPKGDPISLPEGSCPIDFAYAVHTKVGESAKNALVNNKAVSLDYRLQSGDVVEIITAKNAEPSRQWLTYAKSSKAKSKIKHYLNLSKHKIVKPDKNASDSLPKNYSDHIEIKNKKYARATVRFCKSCNPQPGNEIVGFLTKDKKVTIHTKECPNAHALDEGNALEVTWKKKEQNDISTLRIIAEQRVGILTDVLKFFTDHNLTIHTINTKPHKHKILITVEVHKEDWLDTDSLLNDLKEYNPTIDAKIVD
jgi:GTP pyrophosphokinase